MWSTSKGWLCLTKLALVFAAVKLCASVDIRVVSVSVGQTATLQCHNNIQGNVQVVWKDKDLNTLTLDAEVLVEDRRFSIQHKYQNDWDLQISFVRISDAGNYTCCFVITKDCSTLAVVGLVIQIPPSIVRISSDVTVPAGGSTTLVCNATGTPEPTARWSLHRTNVDIRDLNASGTFSIVSAKPNDAGRYECSASNGVPPAASRSVKVTVTFKPQVTVPYREVRQQLNSDTLLDCHIRSNPVGEHYWEKNGRRLDNEPNRYRISSLRGSDETETLYALIVYNLRPDDFARYTCVARNQFGNATESALLSSWHNGTLRMLSSPRDSVAQTGQSIIIDCAVEGMSKDDRLVWLHQKSGSESYIKIFDTTDAGLASASAMAAKRKYAIVGQYNLEIKSAAMDDAGVYHCLVSGLGNFTANLAVVLQDPSIGSECAAQKNVTPTFVTIAIVASLLAAFVVIFIVVVMIIVRYYRKQLARRHEHSAVLKPERYSSLDPIATSHGSNAVYAAHILDSL